MLRYRPGCTTDPKWMAAFEAELERDKMQKRPLAPHEVVHIKEKIVCGFGISLAERDFVLDCINAATAVQLQPRIVPPDEKDTPRNSIDVVLQEVIEAAHAVANGLPNNDPFSNAFRFFARKLEEMGRPK